MHIIVCVDDRGGMLFNRRRVSSDRILLQKIVSLSTGRKLWMNSYSAKLFAEWESNITVSDDFLRMADSGDHCFVETDDLLELAGHIESVTLCCWNRKYPADTYFPKELLGTMQPVFTEEFSGKSHEKITLVRYE